MCIKSQEKVSELRWIKLLISDMQMTEILTQQQANLVIFADQNHPVLDTRFIQYQVPASRPAQITEGSQPPMLHLIWVSLVHKRNQLSASISSLWTGSHVGYRAKTKIELRLPGSLISFSPYTLTGYSISSIALNPDYNCFVLTHQVTLGRLLLTSVIPALKEAFIQRRHLHNMDNKSRLFGVCSNFTHYDQFYDRVYTVPLHPRSFLQQSSWQSPSHSQVHNYNKSV